MSVSEVDPQVCARCGDEEPCVSCSLTVISREQESRSWAARAVPLRGSWWEQPCGPVTYELLGTPAPTVCRVTGCESPTESDRKTCKQHRTCSVIGCERPRAAKRTVCQAHRTLIPRPSHKKKRVEVPDEL